MLHLTLPNTPEVRRALNYLEEQADAEADYWDCQEHGEKFKPEEMRRAYLLIAGEIARAVK